MHDRRFPASEAHRLDDPSRRVWLPTAEVIAALSLRPEDTIADVGAGTGVFLAAIGPGRRPERQSLRCGCTA